MVDMYLEEDDEEGDWWNECFKVESLLEGIE
jgi:hypothetical protein